MASLLYPDEDQSQWPTSLLPVDDGTPPVLQADPRADALATVYQQVRDEMARQQQISADRGLWDDQTGLPTGKGLLDAIQQTGTAVALGTGAPGDAPPPSFTAYHGSPHSFDAFDLSKIGTGEGAQAYGHGMYLADAEGVARGYRDTLGAKIGSNADAYKAANDEFQARLNDLWQLKRDNQPIPPELTANIDALQEKVGDLHGKLGHMYEVQVNADPAHFLDWDKPLSEQHPNVQAALTPEALGLTAFGPVGPKGYYGWADETGKRVGPSLRTGSPGPLFDPKATGQDIYRTLHDNPAVAAEMLQKAGLPGIRYLDAGSRGAGEGSRNSVVFDPATMEIIRKYGLAGLMAGGGAAALSGQQGKQQQ